MLAEHGFKSFVNIFTRLPPNAVNSCLDHIFIKTTQSNLDKFEAGVIQTHITDNFSVFTTVPWYSKDNYSGTVFKKTINYKQLCTILNEENWSSMNGISNVNDLVDVFYAKILNSIEKSPYITKIQIIK